jgi:hypothetical protein
MIKIEAELGGSLYRGIPFKLIPNVELSFVIPVEYSFSNRRSRIDLGHRMATHVKPGGNSLMIDCALT